MPGPVTVTNSSGGVLGQAWYRYVSVADGRGVFGASAGIYTSTCNAPSQLLLPNQPDDLAHFWYAGEAAIDKNKDRCTWPNTCWVAPSNYADPFVLSSLVMPLVEVAPGQWQAQFDIVLAAA